MSMYASMLDCDVLVTLARPIYSPTDYGPAYTVRGVLVLVSATQIMVDVAPVIEDDEPVTTVLEQANLVGVVQLPDADDDSEDEEDDYDEDGRPYPGFVDYSAFGGVEFRSGLEDILPVTVAEDEVWMCPECGGSICECVPGDDE